MKALSYTRGRWGARFVLGLAFVLLAVWPMEGLAQKAKNKSETPASKKVKLPKKNKPAKNKSFKSPLKGTIKLTIADAVMLAFEHNLALGVERLTPSKTQTLEDEQKAVFDVVLNAGVSGGREKTQRQTGGEPLETTTDTFSTSMSLSKYFSPGTQVTLGVTGRSSDASSDSGRDTSTNLEVEVTQPLLRGYGSKVNLARLHQAQLTTRISHYEFRGFSESLLAQVETAYWSHALAVRQVEIVQQSLKIAQRQLKETTEMIRVGVKAETELPATKAEVAIQQQGLIDAKSAADRTRLALLRLMNPPGDKVFERKLILAHPPVLPELKLGPIANHVRRAIAKRSEIAQAKLSIESGELEVVRTKNGLLPKLDFFIRMGSTGYSDSFSWPVYPGLGEGYAAVAGVNLEYPIYNRDARAKHRRSTLDKEQLQKALNNLEQLVELELRQAYIELTRSKEQIAASSATRELQEEKLRVETERFKVGRSTNILVTQAQRDLLAARIAEVRAVVDYLTAVVEFYRLEGSLLENRGIVVSAK